MLVARKRSSLNTARSGHISNKLTGTSEAEAALLFVDRNLIVWFPPRVIHLMNSFFKMDFKYPQLTFSV